MEIVLMIWKIVVWVGLLIQLLVGLVSTVKMEYLGPTKNVGIPIIWWALILVLVVNVLPFGGWFTGLTIFYSTLTGISIGRLGEETGEYHPLVAVVAASINLALLFFSGVIVL